MKKQLLTDAEFNARGEDLMERAKEIGHLVQALIRDANSSECTVERDGVEVEVKVSAPSRYMLRKWCEEEIQFYLRVIDYVS